MPALLLGPGFSREPSPGSSKPPQDPGAPRGVGAGRGRPCLPTRGPSRSLSRSGGPPARPRRSGPAACGKEVYFVLVAELRACEELAAPLLPTRTLPLGPQGEMRCLCGFRSVRQRLGSRRNTLGSRPGWNALCCRLLPRQCRETG